MDANEGRPTALIDMWSDRQEERIAERVRLTDEELGQLVESCSASCGAGEFQIGSQQLRQLLEETAGLHGETFLAQALQECADALERCDGARFDLVLLAMSMLDVAWHLEGELGESM